jgi:hypothetical protein
MNVKPISIRKSFPSGDEIASQASAGKKAQWEKARSTKSTNGSQNKCCYRPAVNKIGIKAEGCSKVTAQKKPVR